MTTKRYQKSAPLKSRLSKNILLKQKACNGCEDDQVLHPDHRNNLTRLRKVGGQIQGIERMINERRYCPEILIQIRAARSALRSLENAILQKHIRECVQSAVASKNTNEINTKISELMKIFSANGK
jgi:DNA-binding FrmR family transcriptional regulator